MIKYIKQSILSISFVAFYTSAFAIPSIVPFGNGAWVYDGTYTENGNKGPTKAGLFFKELADYNNQATAGHEIDQVFAYGGDIEMYCQGSGESSGLTPCGPNEFLLVFYPPGSVSKNKNTWDDYLKNTGDSGYASFESYSTVPKIKNRVIVIDGRVDNGNMGTYDYLDHLNTLSPQDAAHFADKIAKNICASSGIDGVQFDIEPFSFSGEGGSFSGNGQQYFYTELAKDFAGYFGNNDDPLGTNPDLGSDPLHCVDRTHPNGRFFSVFTFSHAITPAVASSFTHHSNGMIVDSLYDLGSKPGGELNNPAQFQQLITTEISNMKKIANQYNLAYQFAIPVSASAHEFESISKDGKNTSTGVKQLTYVQEAIAAIQPDLLKISDPNFKGIDIWSWNQAMWWNQMKFTPASPDQEELHFLSNNL